MVAMKNLPLTQSLPAPLPNGQQIRYFAKLCPHCQAKVEAKHMRGLARTVENRVIVAATAECPECGHSFNIACVIDEQKQVSRLWIPTAFLLWWLSTLRPTALPAPKDEAPARLPDVSPEAVSTDIAGSFGGKAIPAYIEWQNTRYVFERVDVGGPLQAHEVRYGGFVFTRPADTA